MYEDEILDAPAEDARAPIYYAGFWIRCGAIIIDGVILWVVNYIVNLLLMPLLTNLLTGENIYAFGRQYYIYIGASYFFSISSRWLYFAIMTSSKYQGTLGKLAVGIKVIDLDGNRVGFGRATGRFFSKIISGLILGIGYMMAGWDERKQALHDKMANTLVVHS